MTAARRKSARAAGARPTPAWVHPVPLTGEEAAADVPATAPAGSAGSLDPQEPALAPTGYHEVRHVPLDQVRPSPFNPRRNFEGAEFDALVDSVRTAGVLSPLLVRPHEGDVYEIVAGHRRHAAAQRAGLASVPVIPRDMSETEVLEIQLVENIQRSNLHPLDEAAGYHRLMKHGYDAARIAARIGRSVAYVYDRIKLLDLGDRARELFDAGVLTAGHAIELARLTPGQQAQALRDGECIEREDLLWDPVLPDQMQKPTYRAVSVREMRAWIDKNVRFSAEPDPMLFPESALAIASATESKQKVVAITFEHYIPEHARDGKTYFPQSWKRADGEHRSKKCDLSVLGFVAVGHRRGEVFEVCVAKDRCTVHWAPEIKKRKEAAAKRETAAAKSSGRGVVKEQPKKPSWQVEQERIDAERAAWQKLLPTIEAAALEKVKSARAEGNGVLAEILLEHLKADLGGKFDQRVEPGKDPATFLRFLAWQVVVSRLRGWEARRRGIAKHLGLDLAKIKKDAAAAEKVAAAKKAEPKKRLAKRGGR